MKIFKNSFELKFSPALNLFFGVVFIVFAMFTTGGLLAWQFLSKLMLPFEEALWVFGIMGFLSSLIFMFISAMLALIIFYPEEIREHLKAKGIETEFIAAEIVE